MRRVVLFPVMALIVVLGLALPMTVGAVNGGHSAYLYADQDTQVGYVDVTNDGTHITVEIVTTDDWYLVETHVAVGLSEMDIPQKNGNPIPGKFADKHCFDPPDDYDTFTIALPDGVSDAVVIAVHAEVVKETSIELVTNGGFEVPELTSSWGIVPLSDTSLGWSVAPTNPPWDEGQPQGLELQRIKTADSGTQYAELDAYDPVRIWQEIGPCESGLYSLRYAWSPRPGVAQNEMEVYWNGDQIATHSASGSGNSDTVWTQETCAFISGPSDSGFTIEFREIGPHDQLGMFLDSVSVVCVEEETAWAGTEVGETPFSGANWATCFTYELALVD